MITQTQESNPQFHRVLANSFPKGGPFLLAGALDQSGYERFTGDERTPRSLSHQFVKDALQREAPHVEPHAATLPNEVAVSLFAPLYAPPAIFHRWLATVGGGVYIMGHMPWSTSAASLLSTLDYRQVLILRDPRALLLALLFADEMMPRFLKADFAALSPLQQVERMWWGGHLPQANLTLLPFATVYRSMVAWREEPNCLLVRFEDLVSPQFGGDRCRQQQVLKQIADFLVVTADEAQLSGVEMINDPSSHAFLLRAKAQWSQAVAPEVVAFVDEHCAPLCQEAGYAQ